MNADRWRRLVHRFFSLPRTGSRAQRARTIPRPTGIEQLEDRLTPAGPAVSNVVITPDLSKSGPAITATLSSTTPIKGAEFFIDSIGAGGTGTPMAASD